jgi:ABC-type transport system involved in multi-copper enzyme maturation permease subunit
MRQTWAIFVDAYRNLNSKWLFWIVLVLSGLVVASFACVGINEHGIKILFWQIDSDALNVEHFPRDQFYKLIFYKIGIDYWLSCFATILALISTAGIFPDLITSGSIDLFICKPISRLRLFLTEYLAGLLFATLQVTIFSAVCFLIIGLRGGVWEPGLFLAVPIVVCFFSYLFSVCVLLGVITRSTVAAVLLTILFWFGVFMIGSAESTLLMFKTMQQQKIDFAAVQAESNNVAKRAVKNPEQPTASQSANQSKAAAPDASSESPVLDTSLKILYGIKTVLPKTTDTIALLERSLVQLAKLPREPAGPETLRMQAAQQEWLDILRGRSIAWIVGTSLAFEAVVLCLAAWVFCRRDY